MLLGTVEGRSVVLLMLISIATFFLNDKCEEGNECADGVLYQQGDAYRNVNCLHPLQGK